MTPSDAQAHRVAGPESIDTSSVPEARIVVPPPTAPTPPPAPDPKPAFSPATVAASVALSLGAGALGAWGYHHFASEKQAPAAESRTVVDGQPKPFPDDAGNALKGEFEELKGRQTRMEEQVAAIPRETRTAEIDLLKSKVATLEKSGAASDAASTIRDQAGRIERAEASIADMKAQYDDLRHTVDLNRSALLTAKAPPPIPVLPSDAEKPRLEDADRAGDALSDGVQLFEKGKYAEARDLFRKMEESHPEDARIWYFEALSTGFATGDWTDQAVRLVEKGIEREKAGTPDRAAIEATFIGLNKANGKDWLNAYRQRAR